MKVEPAASIEGAVGVPGVKGISQRAVLLGTLAEGQSSIRGFGHAADTESAISVARQLGADVDVEEDAVRVLGLGMHGLQQPAEPLDQPPVFGQRSAEGGAVLEEDVHPDARIGARDTRHLAERGTRGGGQGVVPVDPSRAGLVDDCVREGVREVARERDETVVDERVDRDGPRAE